MERFARYALMVVQEYRTGLVLIAVIVLLGTLMEPPKATPQEGSSASTALSYENSINYKYCKTTKITDILK